MTLGRREFLRNAAAGSAVLTLPAFVAGCGISPVVRTATAPGNPFLEWFSVDEAVVSRVMSALTANGADFADIYFQHKRVNKLQLDKSEAGPVATSVIQGAGLRVVVGDRQGFAYTEDLSADGLLKAAQQASEGLSGVAISPAADFSLREAGQNYSIEVPWSDVGAEPKLALLERVDQAIRAAAPAATNVMINYSDIDERIMIATSNGMIVTDRRPLTRLSAQLVVERDGRTQSGFEYISARDGFDWYSDERVAELASAAVAKTETMFDARRPPLGVMPVVLAAGSSGVVLHEAIGHSLEGDFNSRGISPYSDRLNTVVADAAITVIDQGDLPNARGALNVDDEGNACRRNVLIEEGVLRSYLHDETSARHYGVASTGSGRRESYKHAPMPRMTCTSIAAGEHSRDEIIDAVDRGIIAESYTAADVTLGEGGFRFTVNSGWLVEKGKITTPVKDATISGNGPELLSKINMVGNDPQFDPGGWTCGKNGQRIPVSHGTPTLLVSALQVGDVRG